MTIYSRKLNKYIIYAITDRKRRNNQKKIQRKETFSIKPFIATHTNDPNEPPFLILNFLTVIQFLMILQSLELFYSYSSHFIRNAVDIRKI